VVVPHPKKELELRLFKAIRRQAEI